MATNPKSTNHTLPPMAPYPCLHSILRLHANSNQTIPFVTVGTARSGMSVRNPEQPEQTQLQLPQLCEKQPQQNQQQLASPSMSSSSTLPKSSSTSSNLSDMAQPTRQQAYWDWNTMTLVRPVPQFDDEILETSNSTSTSSNRRRSRRSQSHETRTLESFFEFNPMPNTQQRIRLSEFLGMNPRTVQVWFQNKRQSMKKKYGADKKTVGYDMNMHFAVTNNMAQTNAVSNSYINGSNQFLAPSEPAAVTGMKRSASSNSLSSRFAVTKSPRLSTTTKTTKPANKRRSQQQDYESAVTSEYQTREASPAEYNHYPHQPTVSISSSYQDLNDISSSSSTTQSDDVVFAVNALMNIARSSSTTFNLPTSCSVATLVEAAAALENIERDDVEMNDESSWYASEDEYESEGLEF